MVRILLVKSDRTPANCWMSLLENEFECDPFVFDKMEKKMTLERFQNEVRKMHASELFYNACFPPRTQGLTSVELRSLETHLEGDHNGSHARTLHFDFIYAFFWNIGTLNHYILLYELLNLYLHVFHFIQPTRACFKY